MPWGDIEKYSPEQLTYFNSDPEKWSIEGREAFDDLKKRMTETILELAEKHDGGTIAVVSHGSAIRTFLCGVLGICAADIIQIPHCDNTAVTLLNVENGHIEVEYMGDNSHLPPGCSTFARQKWHKVKSGLDGSNLRFVPMDLDRDRQRYLDYRRDAWLIAHGTAEGFKEEYLDLARRHRREHPRALSLALQGDRPTGLVELSVNRGAAEKIGAIEFYYMEEPYRGTGMSVQLLGQAVSVYRSLGREKLRIVTPEQNARAVAFYQKYGFAVTGEETDETGRQLVMDLDIALRGTK